MSAETRIFLVLTVLISSLCVTQAQDTSFLTRCSYMVTIPREDTPDLPSIEQDGLPWTERPFTSAPAREDLCNEGFVGGGQVILIEEEIEDPITIARLNYNGDVAPVVGTYFRGSAHRIGPLFERANDGYWNLVITVRQDYESADLRELDYTYIFSVFINGVAFTPSVSLLIVNIDDNAPIVHVVSACQVPENSLPGPTSCVYQVTDADGEISTSAMWFRIDSERQDYDVFSITGQVTPSNWFEMTMTLELDGSLNFETNALHIFSVTAFDSLPNNHTVTLMVQVENVESRQPRWTEIFAMQQFDEKTSQSFNFRATDGDTGLNRPIYYTLQTAPEDEVHFSIEYDEDGVTGGTLHVLPMDRDTLEREVFHLSLIAYKDEVEYFATDPFNVVIIINDINDQIPMPLQEEYFTTMMEETATTLTFDQDFGFHDRDLGEHAQYTVHLESVSPPGAAEAFIIAPTIGYQRQTFVLSTTNHSMLDYEVPEFQNIIIRVVATDQNKTEFVGSTLVYISLINWNDEEPIFEYNTQVVSFNETEQSGFYVETALAEDRDIGDRVVHSLLGNAGNYFAIDEDTGAITVAVDNAFDFHRQSELFVQIQATDTLGEPYHTTTSQLIVQLIDINNTPPTLRLPRGSPQVEENVAEGFIITSAAGDITATDPDSTAELVFSINWEESYATKQGRETDPIEFHECVEIETIYPDPTNRGNAIGRLVVKEIRYNVTIDFEMFEMLYLSVVVEDLHTEIGDRTDELTFAIIIIDMNDNWPIWADGSLSTHFRVRERENSGAVIGSVLATDIDGPLYNQVRYTIEPRLDTPDNLVSIDFYTGQITVAADGAIDADVPPRYYLYYTVVASDRCYAEPEDCPDDPTYWNIPGDIEVEILDTNNKEPEAVLTEMVCEDLVCHVEIYEDAVTGDPVVHLSATDLDRDVIYHTVRYQINYLVNARIRDFFAIDLDTGLLYVYYTTDAVLDRDRGEDTHRIFVRLIDNFNVEGGGTQNMQELEIVVRLLDVNDNAPELPPPSELSWEISENLVQGVRLVPDIFAPDIDEPGTDNSRVGYSIKYLNITNRDIDLPDLFDIALIEDVENGNRAELVTAIDLRGYWGTYEIHIEAFDHGIPQQFSDEWYSLVIRPYNFHAPVFLFPQSETTIRLAAEWASINGILTTVGGAFLDRIVATDEDGLEAGVVTFQVVGNDAALNYFETVNDGENMATLRLTQAITESPINFQVVIRATDGGTEPGPLWTEATLNLMFVATTGDPVFAVSTTEAGFTEQEVGLTETYQLPLATDPKNHGCINDCLDIYYSIIGGNTDEHFALDQTTNVLTVVSPLDRDETLTHTLIIAASNSPTATIPLPGSMLTVTVTVREAHPRPVFVRRSYTAGISTADTINRQLLTVEATHSEQSPITYRIDQDSMVADPSLTTVQNNAFILGATSGVLTLNMQPTASMHGMFQFNVIATDTVGEEDTTEIKIYLISTQNRVFFIFVNTLEEIERNVDFVAQTFSEAFNMTCNIDQVVPATDDDGNAQAHRTELRAHFVLDDEPVAATEIEQLRSDTQLLRDIQLRLYLEELILEDLVTDLTPDSSDNSLQAIVYALAALASVLALMCLILIITFLIRTRDLNRRLEALSMTKYGSVDSGLNRVAMAAPGTNKHAAEGSNPIWNEQIKAPDFDAISDTSGDSDLIGVEDLPQFNQDFLPDNASYRDFETGPNKAQNELPNHNNNFGFSSSPFSSEFGNKNFRR